MELSHPNNCPECNQSAHVRHLLNQGKDSSGIPTDTLSYNISDTGRGPLHITILYCKRCGIGWNADNALVDKLQEGYTVYEDQGEYLFEADNRVKIALNILSVLPYKDDPVGRGKRLLDIGCSVGFYLKAAGILGYDAVGVEPSAWAAKYGAENFAARIINQSFFDCRFEENSFDVVLMADVLEHTTLYRAMLEKAYRLLKAGGYLLIVTPNIESVAARMLGEKWWSLKPEHVVYFSRRSLSGLLNKVGYNSTRIRTVGRTFSVLYWLFLLTGKKSLLNKSWLKNMNLYFNFFDQMCCLCQKPGDLS